MAKLTLELCDNGNPPQVWVAEIKHEFVDGCHILTSDDVKGFFLSSRNPTSLLRQIAPVVQQLVKLNHGIDCTVELGDEFTPQSKRAGIVRSTVKVPVVKNTFAVIREAA